VNDHHPTLAAAVATTTVAATTVAATVAATIAAVAAMATMLADATAVAATPAAAIAATVAATVATGTATPATEVNDLAAGGDSHHEDHTVHRTHLLQQSNTTRAALGTLREQPWIGTPPKRKRESVVERRSSIHQQAIRLLRGSTCHPSIG
jgi:hypothetical protein